MMKLSAASALVAASAAAAVIGLGVPAFASTGAVAHTTQTASHSSYTDSFPGLGGLIENVTDDILWYLW
jgi:hypothetical protein